MDMVAILTVQLQDYPSSMLIVRKIMDKTRTSTLEINQAKDTKGH